MQAWMWIAAGGALIAFELATTDLTLASLGLSAIAAGIANAMGLDLVWQALVFAIVAIITLGLIRPIAIRNLRRHMPGQSTNVDRLLQSDAITLSEVTESSGRVKLRGEVWTARTRAGAIAENTQVTVVAIDGAIAIVEAKGARP